MPRKTKSKQASVAIGVDPEAAFDAMLGTNVVKAENKKSRANAAPAIELPKDLQKVLSDYLKHKAAVKVATSAMKQREEQLIEHCRSVQDDNAFNGNIAHTYEVVGKDESVKYICVDKFSVSQDDAVHAEIREVLGDEAYDDNFETKTTVMLKDEVFTDPELKKELVKLLGPKFAKFFVSVNQKQLKKGFKDRLYPLANGDRDRLSEIRDLIPQAKPSLK